MPYGRFLVNWLGEDAVTLSNSADAIGPAANSDGDGDEPQVAS